ncbi:Zinc finger protein CONSTANS-LIKE 13 [Morella rubra]|uniref:Zinc finger protein CONSTANS-LIKE 13 n=1 Tax=Morella rubra TaxID=262757 RepID=A0A6A1W076_9ROSI|nr:Zinc finger protein CONSTANS-LIKE 13 [Morella rubra]
MTDSSGHPQDRSMRPQKRLCDYCSDATAILYCRADSAKLCFLCDREVHSTNQLFSKHTRSLLCDVCDSSPASIFCSTESSVLCQNCDWERHNLSLSPAHNRRPLEGFTGCPSMGELMTIVGFEDNRNAACGQYKEEILAQLREVAKIEPNLNNEDIDAEPLTGFKLLVPEQDLQPGHIGVANEGKPLVFPVFGASASNWSRDSDEAANQLCVSNSSKRRYLEETPVVPEKQSDIGAGVDHGTLGEKYHQCRGTDRALAWADAFLVELKESIRAIVRPTHSLCMELQCRLTGLETKLALTDRALKELNIMRMELFSVRQQLSELSQSVHTVPIQLQTLVKRVDNMEEHLAHVRDALGQDLDEPARDLD